MTHPITPSDAFVARRRSLQNQLETPALLAAGGARSRNYRANTYPFRAKSHFLYLLGEAIPNAALVLTPTRAVLFVEPEAPGDALWHGAHPSMPSLRETLQLDDVLPLTDIDKYLASIASNTATLPTEDAPTCAWLSRCVHREIQPGMASSLEDGTPDAKLADALVSLRLIHDEAAKAQLRWAGEVTAQAHLAGMRATKRSSSETQVFGAMMGVLRSQGFEDSFGPIISTHGEVLHNVHHANPLHAGDLLLSDAGGETPEGWAGDITRVWPVSGTFSPTQRALYEVVLRAQKACIEGCRPGVEFRSLHELAKRTFVEGLVDLGIFKGNVDGLLERGAAAIFFPHGLGHLLGLDVHDMEDLGDRAGYAPGRKRSTNFGDCYLRLDRKLETGMAITIEPGFYQVPAILNDETYTGRVGTDLDRSVLSRFADVRGIRIEDDILITEDAPEVMTRSVTKEPLEVERIVQGG